MNQIPRIRSAALVFHCFALWMLASCSLRLAAESPNVILLITDDQGYGDLSAHGTPVLKTPHMDRLHGESLRFTDFHVAPMCSPTRGQLMTGMDAMRNGCTAVCQGRSMMRRDVPTLADFFQASGYATGHFGKWHLGDSYPHRPQDRGFEETVHHRAWGITSLADYWENSYFDPVLAHNGVDKKFEGYCTDIFFRESMTWMERQHAAQKPFFLYLPTNTPHVPNVCEETYSKPYVGHHEGKPVPASFYGMIANLDANLGKLEAFLQEKGLRDNTILLFMSDNGTQSRQAQDIYNAGMRDRKTSVYEGGHRVPCFVRWPAGKIQAGADIDELTHVQDLLPTLIDLCGLKRSLQTESFDGTSLGGLIKGSASELPDRKLVIQYRTSGAPWDPAVVLWGKWRLLGGSRLYHVGRDPGQKTDVAAKHPDVVRAMANHYDAWYKEAKPMFDRPRWIIIGSEEEPASILYAQDWNGDYCDNRGGLIQARAKGYWNVIVDRAGTYELELRRWPKESNKTLIEGLKGPEDSSHSARPIRSANLQIAGANYTVDPKPADTHIRFRVKLPAGKAQLASALMDEDDRTLCSAMYVYLKRVPDGDQGRLTPASDRKPKGSAPVPGRGAKTSPPSAGAKATSARAVPVGPNDILLADFEATTYETWRTTGTAFGGGPTLTRNRIAGHQGQRVVDTFLIPGGDQATGTLTSPAFRLKRRHLNFLIGGGKTAGRTCVNLIVDGKAVRSAVGTATKNEERRKVMRWVSWDLSAFKGQEARIEIVDQASGGWGHIVVDQMVLSDKPVVPSK